MNPQGSPKMVVYQSHVPALAELAEALGAPLATSPAALADQVRDVRADAVIISVGPAGAGHARPLAQWSHDEWMAAADDPQFDMLTALTTVRAALEGRPAAIILIGPSIAQTGAAGHVALATASEGQRGLMKSVARQWGPQISLGWISVWPPLLYPGIVEADLPEQCELGPFTPPLGQRPGWQEVARAVRGAVLSCGAVTGQTIMVDGGEWMLS